jgi:hypothetical protein
MNFLLKSIECSKIFALYGAQESFTKSVNLEEDFFVQQSHLFQMKSLAAKSLNFEECYATLEAIIFRQIGNLKKILLMQKQY